MAITIWSGLIYNNKRLDEMRDSLIRTLAADRDIFRAEMATPRTEIRGEVSILATELRGEAANLRTEVRGEATLRAELRAEINGSESRIRADLAHRHGRVARLEEPRLVRS